MENKELKISYKIYTVEELEDKDRKLVEESKKACSHSYSPYSEFKVGCAVRLQDGKIVTGANQENVAYPSGLCAERTALFSCGKYSLSVEAICISAFDKDLNPATAYPCGACRQVMAEEENLKSKQKIKVMVVRKDDSVIVFDSVSDLLPFSFEL